MSPLKAETFAKLSQLSQALYGSMAPPPLEAPVVLDEDGFIWLPNPDGSDSTVGSYLHTGMRLEWIPVPERGGLVVELLGGAAVPEKEFEEEGFTTFLSRDELRGLIADLKAIDAQLGASS